MITQNEPLFVVVDSKDVPVYVVLSQDDKYEQFSVMNLNLETPVVETMTFQCLETLLGEGMNWSITKRFKNVKEFQHNLEIDS